jgi:hypothetical protein
MMNRGRVTARVNGGLGNQLFQYASARALALRNDVPLTIDHLTGFPRDFYKRRYMLEHFDVRCELIDRRDSYVSNWGRLKRKIEVRLNQSRPLADRTYLLEDQLAFQPELLELKVTRPIYLEGYWQHEAYFADIRDLLCREITQRTPHDAQNLEFAGRISAQRTPVCLHVRRMHGVANTKDAKPLATVSDWHHVDPSYFQRAVDVMSERVSNPYFFVFADYPDWAREHVRPAHPHEYVTHNGADRDYEDFFLMRQCRHFIIANSTFSWWAAWLGGQPDKVVIAPKEAIGKMIQGVPDSWLLV